MYSSTVLNTFTAHTLQHDDRHQHKLALCLYADATTPAKDTATGKDKKGYDTATAKDNNGKSVLDPSLIWLYPNVHNPHAPDIAHPHREKTVFLHMHATDKGPALACLCQHAATQSGSIEFIHLVNVILYIFTIFPEPWRLVRNVEQTKLDCVHLNTGR